MAQLVFIHGVNTRRAPNPTAYDSAVTTRRKAFLKECFEGGTHGFFDPYWGGHGAEPDLGGLYLVMEGDSALNIGGASTPLATDLRGKLLLEAAREDFDGVLNTLALVLGESEVTRPDALRIADYLAGRDNGQESTGAPGWLADPAMTSDDVFLQRLDQELPEKATEGVPLGGLGNPLKTAGRRIVGAVIGVIDGPAERLARQVTPTIARFFGDVFVYLREGVRRHSIQAIVTQDLVAAARAAQTNNEPLIVVGHSMGANIFYDMITDPEWQMSIDAELGFPFRTDLFLSVGTQLGLFEELDLFKSSVPGQAPFPIRLNRWWHVYNRMDVLCFAAKGIFAGIEQFSIDTRANIVEAHGAYFSSPVLFRRLRRRMQNAGIIET